MIFRIQKFIDSLFKTLFSLVKVIFMTRFNTGIAYPPGEKTCTILGNGPSLTASLERKPEFLGSSSLFCVNYFANSNQYEKLQPERYVIAAPETWLKKINTPIRNSYKVLYDNIATKTNWPITLYLPSVAIRSEFYRDFVRPRFEKNKNINVYFINLTPIEGFRFISYRFFRWNWGMPRPHNVLIPALIIAVNSGFKKIYLLGSDHSWIKEITVNNDNQVMIRQVHFYESGPAVARPMRQLGTGSRKLHEVFLKFYYSFASYFTIRDYAEKRGVEIINATPGSYIDAFDRFQYD